MAKRKQRDLPLDELVRQFVRCAQRMRKSDGGDVRMQLVFGPGEPTPKRTRIPQGKSDR